MAQTSHIPRTLKWLRELGAVAGKSEWWCGFSHRHKEVFPGLCDILALAPTLNGVVFVQVCSVGDMATRGKKILDSSITRIVLGAGNSIWIVGWVKPKYHWKRKTWNVIEKGEYLTWEPAPYLSNYDEAIKSTPSSVGIHLVK